ncbi:alpha-glucosidase C-terminal domain-containing protein, partial [Lachnoclostridium sp.]|uniref:alpha-glucosidase C-terminal domain-containing protein n=1 Tax=Lachnoclostridium sp. TaxID=2028282 RepID=UPI00289A1E32
TTGTPWMKLNQNYHWLNVEAQKEDADSILNFYKKLIKIKKETTGLIYGDYELLMEESESIYAYTRNYEEKTYLIVCNISKEHSELQIDLDIMKGEILLSNYADRNSKEIVLKPYECRLYSL